MGINRRYKSAGCRGAVHLFYPAGCNSDGVCLATVSYRSLRREEWEVLTRVQDTDMRTRARTTPSRGRLESCTGTREVPSDYSSNVVTVDRDYGMTSAVTSGKRAL